jgi:hypothetical protein
MFSTDPTTNAGKASQEIGDWGYLYDVLRAPVTNTVTGSFIPF